MRRRDLSKALVVTAAGTALLPPRAVAAGGTPPNFYINTFAPRPEHYGAAGDGVTLDDTALAKWMNASPFLELGDKVYLTSGVKVSAAVRHIEGRGENSQLRIRGNTGDVGLHFVSPSGNSTHFITRAVLRNLQITCNPSSRQIIGIWLDNAELRFMESVYIDLAGNTFAGSVRYGSYALLGAYNQDCKYVDCTFTAGAGPNSDGVYLLSLNAGSLPNSNVFVSCRAQSNGGVGVRQQRGVGTMWIGGKLQANRTCGWLEADDGMGNGGVGTCLYGVGFEKNGDGRGSGCDLNIEIGRSMAVRDCSFQTPPRYNRRAIYAKYAEQCVFENNFCYSSQGVEFAGGHTNTWSRNNKGFGELTIAEAGDALADEPVQSVSVTGPGSYSPNTSVSSYWLFVVRARDGFTVGRPVAPSQSQQLTLEFQNETGGSLGPIRWDDAFALAGNKFPTPMSGKSRTITFKWNRRKWVEVARTWEDIGGANL